MSVSTGNGVRTFALAGMGNIGGPIADELLSHGHPLSILTRDTSKAEMQRFASAGAQLVAADYADVAQLARALAGVDAVISALGGGTGDAELNLAKAAKAAGVKIYVPSEFGLDYTAPGIEPLHPFVAPKVEFRKELEKIGLPYFAITTSSFAEWTLGSFFGVDLAGRKATLTGDSSRKFSLTAIPDVAEFTRRALTTVALPPAGSGRVLRVQSFTASFDELLRAAERVLGGGGGGGGGASFAVTRRAYEDAAKNQGAPTMQGFVDWILACVSDGRALLDQSKLANDEAGFKSQYTLEKVVQNALKAQA